MDGRSGDGGGAGLRTILLLGGSGQVGWELRRTLAPLGEMSVPDRDALDLRAHDAIGPGIAEHAPDVIVNAAAYNDVDGAEGAPEEAFAINAEAVRRIGMAASEAGAGVVHFSTDYVFPGDADRPYREDDPTGPVNVYGESKLAGEEALRETGCDHVVLRTSWVFSNRRANFLRTMCRLFREREIVEVVDDQIGSPTWARMIAEATAHVVARWPTAFGELADVYHLSASGSTSWHGFAEEILGACRRLGLADAFSVEEVAAVSSDHFASEASRPRFSVLSNVRIKRELGLVLPLWATQVTGCLEDLADAGRTARLVRGGHDSASRS